MCVMVGGSGSGPITPSLEFRAGNFSLINASCMQIFPSIKLGGVDFDAQVIVCFAGEEYVLKVKNV